MITVTALSCNQHWGNIRCPDTGGIRQAVMAEGCITRPLVLHAENGSPMKGATMKVTMEKLGITASYSRPRVSNDNPFSEALFRT
jgi:putative transposase